MERPNFYRAIHKTLRRSLALFLAELGAVNPEDREAVAGACGQWTTLHRLMEAHALHEDAHIGPVLAEAAPELFRRMEAGHDAHHAGLANLDLAFRALAQAAPEDRPERLQEAYLAVTAFMATDLAHMQMEELEIMPALQARFDDATLLALHGRIVGSLSPAEKAETFSLMFPAVHELERLELMRALQEKLPPEAFGGLSRLVASVLPAAAWESLQNRLDLAPVVA